jgi:predicted metal-dependent hydrolase
MRLFSPQYSDGQRLEIAGAPVRLKVSGRARRVSLRVDRARREVLAIAPSARRLAEAAAFAHERRAWIAARLAELPSAQGLAPGTTISLLGQPCRLEVGPGRARLIPACEAAPTRLVACGRETVEPVTVARIVKREARAAFEARAAAHCAALGAPTPPIALTDARTRWGSCTPASHGRPASIRLSWRLALAPVAVADYVVAHECAHLIEANHGPHFWALVRRLVGDPKPHRAWLRTHGPALHAFGR